MYFGTDVYVRIIIICVVYLVVIMHKHQRINTHLPFGHSVHILFSEPKDIEEHNLYLFFIVI